MRHGLLEGCAECTKKNRGKYLFARYLPRMSLIFSTFRLFFYSGLGGGDAGDGHAEGGA